VRQHFSGITLRLWKRFRKRRRQKMTLKFTAKTHEGWTVHSPLEAFTFPGGEAHIKGADSGQSFAYQIADLRGADSHELFQLAMWAKACGERGEKTVLILPYLPAARADRGVPNGAEVYSDFILNMVSPNQIITVDPHSDYMPGVLSAGTFDTLTIFPVRRIIRKTLGDRGDYYSHPYVGVIAPDKGAVWRATSAAKALGVPLFKAEKTRDFETGKLNGFTCEELPADGKLLIVDDICDGGGTFIGLAKATGLPHDRLDLWVTHGIFSKGLNDLIVHFDHIYTTDSYPADDYIVMSDYVTRVPVLPYLIGEINV
jgi:ribose-phosphate pyrophosphokinase